MLVPTQAATLPLIADINSKELNLFPAKGKKIGNKHVKSGECSRLLWCHCDEQKHFPHNLFPKKQLKSIRANKYNHFKLSIFS